MVTSEPCSLSTMGVRSEAATKRSYMVPIEPILGDEQYTVKTKEMIIMKMTTVWL
jgi:hypothetical protein